MPVKNKSKNKKLNENNVLNKLKPYIYGCIIGFLTFMIGLVSDLVAGNRKILSDTQYHVRRMEYDHIHHSGLSGRRDSEKDS